MSERKHRIRWPEPTESRSEGRPHNVVPADIGDEEPLMHLLRLRHQEERTGPFDQASARGVLQRGLLCQGAMIGVIRRGALVEASIGVYVSKYWDTDQLHLEPFWSYVLPPYRKGYYARDLIQFGKWVSQRMRLPLVIQATANDEEGRYKVELYGRKLPKWGETFLFDPAGVDSVST